MRFKEWLQNEINLDFSGPVKGSQNPAVSTKATDDLAKRTMANFGNKVVGDMLKAPSPKAAMKTATNFAQQGIKKQTADPAQAQTNVGSVGAKVYQMATGQEPKTL